MSNKSKTTSTNRIPTWLEQGSQQAVALGQRIASRPYQGFGTSPFGQNQPAPGPGATTTQPAAPAFDASQWRRAGRMGLYVNPSTGETLNQEQYEARRNAPPSPAAPGGGGSFVPTEAQYLGEERVAQMDANERRAYELAAEDPTGFNRDLDRARYFTEQAARPFSSFDVNEYMNPYIKGALDPAAREVREEIARQTRDIGSRSAMEGAFGGSRGAILESEARRGGIEAISDLYSKGYASAFESGVERIQQDRTAAARAAEQFRATGAQGQAQLTQSIQNLLTTGGMQRAIKQAGIDFKYQEFLEARDWDITNLGPLLAALQVPSTTTQENVSKKSSMQTIAGIGMAVAGGFTMNPGLVSAGINTAFGSGGEAVAGAMPQRGVNPQIGPYATPDTTTPRPGGTVYGFAPLDTRSSFTPVALA